ncbi:MAG: MarR family transcriptional regulator, partial [Coriobacteriales bacterium]
CGVNITQARIMFYIGTHEVQPIGKVGSSLFLKPSTITASANLLYDEGLIIRSLDALDRRRICIQLTQKGVDVTPSFIPAVRKAFEEDRPHVFEDKHDELRQLLLPASSHVFFDTDEEDIASIATRIARDLKLDHSQDEIITHITRVLVIESISYFLSQMTEFEHSHELFPNESRILFTLGNGGTGARLKDLAAAINIRPNVASLAVRSLFERGLITRDPDKKDGRAVHATLSRKGARLVHKAKYELCEIYDASFPGLAERAVSEFFPQ